MCEAFLLSILIYEWYLSELNQKIVGEIDFFTNFDLKTQFQSFGL